MRISSATMLTPIREKRIAASGQRFILNHDLRRIFLSRRSFNEGRCGMKITEDVRNDAAEQLSKKRKREADADQAEEFVERDGERGVRERRWI